MPEEQDKKQAGPGGAGEGSDGETATLCQTLAERENRLKELEATVESRTKEVQSRDAELAKLHGGMAATAGKYRQLLLVGAPEVPEEMVKGDTAEEIDASFQKARQVVEKVRQGLEARQQKERVPAGAPPRSPIDPSAMSPQEKIAYGLSKGR